MQLRQQIARPLLHLPLAQGSAAAGQLAPGEDVSRNSQVGKGHHLLVDHADTVDERVPRTGDRELAIVEADLAAVSRDDAGEHLEQRGLAGAVLAHQGVGFPAADTERHTAQRPHGAERLVNIDELEAWHLVACS